MGFPKTLVSIFAAKFPEDAPALTPCGGSRISAALVAHDMDVVAAQAYCRKRLDDQLEAVDLIWVRCVPGDSGIVRSVRSRDVAHMGETLDALVRGRASFEGAVSFARAVRAAEATTRVRFERDPRDGATLLLVEAVDRPGLLLVVSRTLFEERVQIVGSHVTTQGGSVLDRFQVPELNGNPLSGARQLAVQTAVVAALRDPDD